MVLFKLALTSRSLHLSVGGQLISSISFEMFGCSLSFSSNLEFVHLTVVSLIPFFLISSTALLHRRMLFFVIILDKGILETTIRFISFHGFPDYQDATYQLIIFSIGQWTTSLPQFASFISFGSFGSLLLRVLLLGRVYHFVAMS